MFQNQLNLHSIKMSDRVIAPSRRTELGDATICTSVRRSLQVNVDGIIAKNHIRKHLHTSMDFRIFYIRMLFHFDNLDFNNFIKFVFLFIFFLLFYD